MRKRVENHDIFIPAEITYSLHEIKRNYRKGEVRDFLIKEMYDSICEIEDECRKGINEDDFTLDEVRGLYYDFADTLEFLFKGTYSELAVKAWKKAIKMAADKGITCDDEDPASSKKKGYNTIARYVEKVNKYKKE